MATQPNADREVQRVVDAVAREQGGLESASSDKAAAAEPIGGEFAHGKGISDEDGSHIDHDSIYGCRRNFGEEDNASDNRKYRDKEYGMDDDFYMF